MRIRSDWPAASIGPDEADGADAADGPDDDHRRPFDNDRRPLDDDNAAAVGLTAAIGTAMPAGAASARGIRRTEACEGACNQNGCCEKGLHVLSHCGPQRGAVRNLDSDP
jgi:hypothetical protein